MILALLLQAAVPAVPETLPTQALPAKGCAAYLWSVADRRFVAMASADPAQLRIVLDGKPVDVARTGERGTGDYGFAGTTDYAAAAIQATLEMTIARRTELTAGAAIPSGTLTIVRAGQDSVVVPVAGLVGCA